MSVAKPLHLRLFLEGVEVPVVSAQVGINVNAPATATIQIVPLDEAMELMPRTMVHLFFLSDDVTFKTNAAGRLLDEHYRLLFAGEVVGFSFVKSPNGRGLILQCLDFSSYWDSAHATAVEYGPNGNAFTQKGSLWGSDITSFDDLVSHQAEQLVSWIHSRPLTPGLETVSGLAGGIIRVMEALGGVPNHHRGVNDFFTIAELRCRLLSQITAEENDNSAANLLDLTVFDEWVRSGLQNAGQQITFRDMMKILFHYIYYECVPNPAAKYDSAKQGTTTIGSRHEVFLLEHPTVVKAVSDIDVAAQHLVSVVDTHFTDVSALQFTADFLAKDIKKILQNLKNLSVVDKKGSLPLQEAMASIDAAIASLEAAKKQTDADKASFTYARSSLFKAQGKLAGGKDLVVEKTRDISGTVNQRLRTQIVRPDCWFVAPPKCNVLFPEHYTQLVYDRTYITEVTRTLTTFYNSLIGTTGDAELFGDRVFAPNVSNAGRYVMRNTGEAGWRVLMPHEVHTGIVPRLEWVPDTQMNADKDLLIHGIDQFRNDRINWARNVAYFHFYKYRYGPRTASICGRFNPMVVCGFPAVIITRPFLVPGVEGVREVSRDLLAFVKNACVDNGAPQQLVGMVAALQHNVDQQGGTTSISLNHVRTHMGADDAFIKDYAEETKSSVTRQIRVVLRRTDVLNNPELLDLLRKATPQGAFPVIAPLTVKQETTQSVSTSSGTIDYTTTEQVELTKPSTPPLTALSKIRDQSRNVLVPSPFDRLKIGDKGCFGTIYGIEVVDPSLTVEEDIASFEAIALFEDVDVSVSSSLPVESLIFPKWMSKKYLNENIGEGIYNPFFGVDSIVDELDIFGLEVVNNPNPDIADMSPDQGLETVQKSLAAIEEGAIVRSIQSSINLIGYLYGLVKSQGLDVDRFITAFTSRPIATKSNVLGSDDLVLDKNALSSGQIKATQGTIGFHTTSVHPDIINAGPLVGLSSDPDSKLPRINNHGTPDSIPPEYDVRKDKLDQVLRYLRALEAGNHAFKG